MARPKKKNWTYAIGRRRSASARVRLFKGRGGSLVNGKPIEEYFPGLVYKQRWNQPFEVADVEGKYYITVVVLGGGKSGQLDAVVLGTARALAVLHDNKFRGPLKKSGLLTRDPRIRERRKVGMGGKARRKKQSPKR